MKTKNRLIRDQLERSLGKFRPLRKAPVPAPGWIRAIRDALGMSGRQLAGRLGLSKQRAAFIEKQELDGSATLKNLRRVAEQLDCVFVYGFVPKTNLGSTVRRQAERYAARQIARAHHTMQLEAQSLSEQENKAVLHTMVEEFLEKQPRNLWDAE
jgi:predicted DNA-binding mobile mystery protein A